MSNINDYANDLLLDFIDAAHVELSGILKQEYSNDWLELGVRKHFPSEYFARVERMLGSPMRVVDMGKEEDDIYGIEHLWNIINGNWNLLRAFIDDKDKIRLQACLEEVTELRNNLAHRRKHHVLLRSDLIRSMGSCQLVLSALRSPRADSFSEVAVLLSSGGTPWGATLEGSLPPSDEMYAEFVGRPNELDGLSAWLASATSQILVSGYGGAGKSALAYKFAREVRDSSNENLIAVCWVSAKKTEFSDGSVRERPADFSNLDSFVRAVWSAMYGPDEVPRGLEPDRLLLELREMPILLVVDDFDTVSGDYDLTEFLLHKLRLTSARVIYTSRQLIHAVKNLDVPPFAGQELRDFVFQRSVDYSVDQSSCLQRLEGIESVTGGYPLFVDDLIHHAAFIGIDEALKHWTQRKGDAARQYALQRQIEYLGHSSGEVLIALSVANRALRIVEISGVAGLTDDDSEAGIRELLRWRMVNPVKEDDTESPVYRMNNNTGRLVQQTFKDDPRLKTFSTAFKALTGERVPEAKKSAIAKIIGETNELARRSLFGDAEKHLIESMTGELTNSPDLFGVLGRLYSIQEPVEQYGDRAQEAFQQSHRMGSLKVDTYFHWAELERKIAESMIEHAPELEIADEAISEQWRQCEKVAELGIGRCGPSQSLFYFAGYGASREANASNRAKNFSYAQGAYTRSIDWFNKALTAPVSDRAAVSKGMIYRGLTLAYEGIGDAERLRQTLRLWYAASGSDRAFEGECQRLMRRHPELRTVSEFQYLLARGSL